VSPETAVDLRETLAALPPQYRSEDQLAIFRSVVAPGMPDGVVALVYHYAASLGLDPVRKEVLAVSTKSKNAQGGWDTVYNIIVNIHGIMKLLGRQADYCGLRSACVYPGEKCVIHDDGTVEHSYDVTQRPASPGVLTNSVEVLPLGAWACITRLINGKERLFTTWLPFSQCAQVTEEWKEGRRTGNRVLRSTWATRADWMTEKCAIASVARKAYDHALGRVYAPEEFGAVSTPAGAIEVGEDIPLPVVTDPGEALLAAHVSGRPRAVPEESAVAVGIKDALERQQTLVLEGNSAEQATAKVQTELVNEVKNTASLAGSAFDPPRVFLKETPNGTWLVDADVLAELKSPSPVLLEQAGGSRLVLIRTLLHNVRARKEASGGR